MKLNQNLMYGTCRSANGPRRTLSTSLSVLSPFDVQEEWTKIWEILGSFSSGFDKESPHLIDEVQREFQNRIGKFWACAKANWLPSSQ